MWSQDQFFEYRMDSHLSDIPQDKVPILQMEHLRQKDFPITRGISYERTVYTFLAQIELSSSLHVAKSFQNIVILLNEEGALICEDGIWSLIFTPDKTEQYTLDEDAELYPIFMNMLKKVESGEMCRITLESINLRALMNNSVSFDLLDTYCKKYPGGYLAVAQDIVKNGTADLFRHVPVCRCGKLTTVDFDEREAYQSIMSLMKDYIFDVDHADGEPLRPLSVSVFGAPGSGKSFGVKQIAKSFGRFDVYTLNLSQYSSVDEMFEALDKALSDAKRIPLIFFDEFDSEYHGMSRGWLKYLLAPMQDGEFTVDGEIRTIQSAVFVFAGGTASSFRQFQPSTPEDQIAFKNVKGPDFVSRLRGMLNVKGPNPTAPTDQSYIIRRAMLLRDLITRKIPNIYNKETGKINISDGLLSALLRVSTYRHGTRSMEFILDMSHLSDAKRFTPSCLPMQDQMDIHLDYVDFNKKLSFERVSGGRFNDFMVVIHAKMCEKRLADAKKYNRTPKQIEELKAQPSIQPWENLSEDLRENYRRRARAMIEGMVDITFPVGLRPVTQNLPDTIRELYGNSLAVVTELVHDNWREAMENEGWKYGPVMDPIIKTSPDLKHYSELSTSDHELFQQLLRALPEFLNSVGLEMYRKVI